MIMALPLTLILILLVCVIGDSPRTPPKKKTSEERWEDFQYNLSCLLGGFLIAIGMFAFMCLINFI